MRDLPGRAGTEVRVCGWAHAVGHAVLTVRDHTGMVDVIAADDPLAAELGSVVPESAVEVRGRVEVARQPHLDRARLVAERLHVPGPALGPVPIDERSPLDARLDWRYLDLRHPRQRLVFEVQTTLERAMRQWWAAHGFIELHSPKLRATPNRSGRELFTVQYFDRPAYLAQSPQFHKQMAMAAGLDRVFEIGPVFRANPLLTPRHDTEFTSVDVEVSWIDSHENLMAMEERWLQHAVGAVAEAHGDQVAQLFGRRLRVPEIPFPRITMAEAQRVLAAGGRRSSAAAGDIDAGGERLVAAHVAAAHDHELVFVTDYPAAVRPFYHMRLDEGSDLTRSFDLLWNGLEVTTGAQREHRLDRLTAQAGADPSRAANVAPYLDFFRYGCPPHGGFGAGLTRLLASLLGVADVREVTYLPRDRHRLTP